MGLIGTANHSGSHYGGNQYKPAHQRNDDLPPPGLVRVVQPDGSTHAVFRIPPESAWWFRNAKMAYPDSITKEGDDEIITIPFDKAKIDRVTPGFSSCTFDSTKDYLQAIWGRVLDTSDREWLSRHQYAEEMGVPQEYTPTAIQMLLDPYNMAISRMRVRAGCFYTGEALKQWERALGCNPFAAADHNTSNAQAAEQLGISLDEANRLWRFEFCPDPLRPSILGERQDVGLSVSTGGGKKSGHARYLAPRGNHGQWFLSMQLLPSREVEYVEAPALPEYEPREDRMSLNLWHTKAPDSSDVDTIKWYDAWAKAGSPGKLAPPAAEPLTPEEEKNAADWMAYRQRKARAAIPVVGGFSRPGRKGSIKSDFVVEVRVSEADGGNLELCFDPNLQLLELANLIETGQYKNDGLPLVACRACTKYKPSRFMVSGMDGCCLGCYGEIMAVYKCVSKKCQLQFDPETYRLPQIHGADIKDGALWGCPKCHALFSAGNIKSLQFMAAHTMNPEDAEPAVPTALPRVADIAQPELPLTH